MRKKPKLDLGLNSYEELFMNENERIEASLPKIYDIPIKLIDDFPEYGALIAPPASVKIAPPKSLRLSHANREILSQRRCRITDTFYCFSPQFSWAVTILRLG